MKRSASEIMKSLTPAKSTKRYNETWNAFHEFTKKQDRPTEDDFIEYFDYLQHEKICIKQLMDILFNDQ